MPHPDPVPDTSRDSDAEPGPAAPVGGAGSGYVLPADAQRVADSYRNDHLI